MIDLFVYRKRLLYIDDLIVPITAIINLSMQDGVVPHDFKQALVTPLIKKETLCRYEFSASAGVKICLANLAKDQNFL